jgi:hypothetical protein
MRFIDGEGLRVLRMKPQAGDPLDASRAYSNRNHFPVMRGVFGFDWAGAQGTLTVTEGRSPGFVHATVYCTRGSAQPVPLRMEAEVREGWIRQITAGVSNRVDEVLRVVERLFEVATIAGQRTVRIQTAA